MIGVTNFSLSARQEQIISLVNAKGFLKVEELAKHFQVTPQTMRRDVNVLAAENKIRRHHGGASALPTAHNTAYGQRKHMQSDEKQAIAKAVAAYIPDHASVFINIGTTNEAIAKALLHHTGLKIITNNLHVAATVSSKDDFECIVAGGFVRPADGGIIGEATSDFVRQFRADFAIIGTSGIEEDGSLLDFDYQEVSVSQALLANCRRSILACDHSKFSRQAMIRICHLNDIDVVATDRIPPEPFNTLNRESETELLLPSSVSNS